ncbi:MAG: hypothetical protein AB1705_21340 [Verrucomicrobiota bacterium]
MNTALSEAGVAAPHEAVDCAADSPQTSRLPPLAWILVFGVFCIPIGVLWDISWHSAIGRDSFWTPAHMVIYLGGAVPGMISGWIALRTHFFGSETERSQAVSIFGLRAPLGAWLTIWGATCMLTSAPFDDWWHNAYGLDVKILSPPHTLLAIGMYAVAWGVLLQLLSLQNRLGQPGSRHAGIGFVLVAGVMLNMLTIFLTEKSQPNQMRGPEFFYICAWQYPVLLALARRASNHRWACSIVALTYMGIQLAMIWILPLFRAEPKLAPIYIPIDHMVPPSFPLLMIVPAFALDLYYHRWLQRPYSPWLLAGVFALIYLAILMPIQWHFSAFLISPGADNAFFAGNRQFPYYSPVGEWKFRYWGIDRNPVTLQVIFVTIALAYVSSRIGLGIGHWMTRVRR